jgi:cytochrome c oxidase subunit 2
VLINIAFLKWKQISRYYKYELQSLEIIWTRFPCFVLVFLGVPSLELLYKREFSLSNLNFRLKVIAHQWYWTYDYRDISDKTFDSYILPILTLPDSFFRVLEVDNRAVLPFNSINRLLVLRADVLHSFALPRCGLKIDATPGRLNQTFIIINRPAVVYGQCSEICGANHRFIPIVLESSSPVFFKSWLKLLS